MRICRRSRRIRLVCLGIAGVTWGCGWVQPRSDFDRDPFVMSHLTHSREDPLFAGSENESTFQRDESAVQSASISNKPGQGKKTTSDYQNTVYREQAAETPAPGRGKDYSWLEGRLGHRTGKEGGWFIQYARSFENDNYGGELRFANTPRLGLLREGDRVLVRGAVVSDGLGDHRYRVDSIVLHNP